MSESSFWPDVLKDSVVGVITAAVIGAALLFWVPTRDLLLTSIPVPIGLCLLVIAVLVLAFFRGRPKQVPHQFVPSPLQEKVLELIRFADKPLDMQEIVMGVDDARLPGQLAGTRDIELAVRALSDANWLEQVKSGPADDTYHLDARGLEFCNAKGYRVYLQPAEALAAQIPVTASVVKLQPPSQPDLDPKAESILVLVANHEDVNLNEIARHFGVGQQLAQFHLDELLERRFAEVRRFANGDPSEYRLSVSGRKHLAKRGLLT